MGREGEDDQHYSIHEYVAMEESAEYKSEFYHGEIHAMAGGSIEHSEIAVNCTSAMKAAFKEKGCRVFESNLRIYIESLDTVLYPDASVFCDMVERNLNSPTLAQNPTLIMEVLSNGTANYDRGNKFFKYQMIPSLRTYVLVEQSTPEVHVNYKHEDGSWEVDHYDVLEQVVELKPLGVSIPMEIIYEWIQFR